MDGEFARVSFGKKKAKKEGDRWKCALAAPYADTLVPWSRVPSLSLLLVLRPFYRNRRRFGKMDRSKRNKAT